MQTPLDRFHNALLNLAAQKAKKAAPARDEMPIGFQGERVVWKPARNLTHLSPYYYAGERARTTGTVDHLDRDTLYVTFDDGGDGVGHIVHWVREAPLPEFTDLAEVDKWLAS